MTSIQLTYSLDPGLVVHKSTLNSGWTAVSFPKRSPPGQRSSALQSPQVKPPILSVNLTRSIPVNPSQGLIFSLLQHTQSFSAVLKSLTLIHKACRTWRRSRNHNPTTTWSSIKSSIKSSILRCFTAESELLIANNKIKHLIIQVVDGVYYVSDCSFRSRIGVPLICKKTILTKCIVAA